MKMDAKLVSNEDHELDYFKRAYGVGRKVTRQAKNAVGPSRRKILAWLILNDKIETKYLEQFDKHLDEPEG